MLQYFAQGAAMALEDAVCLAAGADEADGDFAAAFRKYQATRLVRASRVQISAGLLGMIFHVPDGVGRLARNDLYRGRAARRHYDAPELRLTAPGYGTDLQRK